MKIIIEKEVKIEDIADALISAFDPACRSIGYWGEISDYTKPPKLEYRNDPKEIYRYVDYPLNKDGYIIIKVNEIDEGEKEFYKLGLPELERGLKIMLEKYPKHFADLVDDNADGDTADCLVQLSIFGELIYG